MDGRKPPRQLTFPFAEGDSVIPFVPVAPRASLRLVASANPARNARRGTTRAPDELALEQTLSTHLPAGRSLQVTLHDNRFTMVTVRRGPLGYRLRLHRMFAGAIPRLARALARYVVNNDARAARFLSEFVERNQDAIVRRPVAVRRVVLRTKGDVHDLALIFADLNGRYFGGQLDARITWGPTARIARPQQSIKLGSFVVEDRLIRINPILDHSAVPGFVVAWIVFHEMLHGKHHVSKQNGRRCFHGPAFLADERAYADHDRAQAWERAHIDTLLGGGFGINQARPQTTG